MDAETSQLCRKVSSFQAMGLGIGDASKGSFTVALVAKRLMRG